MFSRKSAPSTGRLDGVKSAIFDTVRYQAYSLSTDTKAYIITDKLSYLPFGLWDSELNYTTEFTNTPDGVRTMSKAPLGFVVESRWGVREQEDGSGWVVEERVEGKCPWGLKWFVQGTMEKAHETVLANFVEKMKQM